MANKKSPTWEQALDETIESLKKTMKQKHYDYGSKNIGEFGTQGLVVRIWDKVSRLKNLVWNNKKPDVEDENVIDTFLDLAGYGIIGYMLEKGTWELPMEKEEDRREAW